MYLNVKQRKQSQTYEPAANRNWKKPYIVYFEKNITTNHKTQL